MANTPSQKVSSREFGLVVTISADWTLALPPGHAASKKLKGEEL
jgi:hypothetical protein